MFIAAILLVGAVVNLYVVQNNNVRLGLIGGYTAAFALSLGVLTNAKRAELYGSTAASVYPPQVEKTLTYSIIGMQRFLSYL
jgi:hypothetical protein